MDKHTILILEDNEERIREFKLAVASLGPQFRFRFWHDAPAMIVECSPYLSGACLISLDHDLNPPPNSTTDPGTGLEVAEFLGQQDPVCPVIIHTSNSERRWSMHNEFRFGKWLIEIVPPVGENWIQHSWLPKAKTLLGL
jgi:hypothetical protein